jgi:hypothetical protein
MFDTVMEVEISEIKSVLAIAFLQHSRGEVWYEKAKGGGKVVCCPNQGSHFIELDIFTIARQDTWRKKVYAVVLNESPRNSP